MKNKTLIGIIGIILAVIGLFASFPLALKGSSYAYGLILTGAMVIIGIILIASAFGE